MQTIFIVGGAAIDITGKPENICRERDSNLGRVQIHVGGVGHNIAKRLAALDYQVELVTAIGSGFHAGMVRESCSKANISLAHTLACAEHTGTYIGVFDEDGDMLVGISDMSVLDHLTPDYLSTVLAQINASALCVIDGQSFPPLRWSIFAAMLRLRCFSIPSAAQRPSGLAKISASVLQSSQTGSKRASSPASPAIRFAESTAPPTGFWSRA